RDRAAQASLLFLTLVSVAALLAGALAIDPLRPDVARVLEGPPRAFWFGSDELGRDILARVLYGARTSLLTAAGAVSIAALVGVPIGLVRGLFCGWGATRRMRVG